MKKATLIQHTVKTRLALLARTRATLRVLIRGIQRLAYTLVSRPLKFLLALLIAAAFAATPFLIRGTQLLKSALGDRAEIFCAFLLAAAFATIQVLIGGTRLLFSLPAYGLLGIMGLVAIFSYRRPKPQPHRLCLITTALFFGYVIGRAVLSPVPYLARADLYSVLSALVVYFFIACIFTESKRRISLVIFLLGLGMVHVVIGAIQFRNDNNFMLISFLQRYDYDRRASGFYVCPNHLAGLLEVLAIFGLSIICWSRGPNWGKMILGYVVGVCYLGVLLTSSRGGYLSTVTSLAVFAALSLAILRRSSSRIFWGISGAGLVGAVIIAVTIFSGVKKSDFLSGRAQTIFEVKNVRLDMWQAALEQWRLQPFFGTGSGTHLFYGRQFRSDRVQRDAVYVHNDYLHLLAEYGLLGIALFFVFLGSHLRNGWKNFKRLGPKRVAVSHRLTSGGMALQVGGLSAVSAYIVHSIFDFNLHIPANVLLLALVFGILANAGTLRETEPTAPKKSVFQWRLVLPAIGIILAVQCVRLLPGEYFAERSRTALRDDQPASSVFFALKGLAWEKQNPNLYQYLGNARAGLGDRMPDPVARLSFYEAATQAFEKGRALAPRDTTFAINLGFTYDELGRFEEGEWMFNEALELDPNSLAIQEIYEAHLERWRTGKTPKPSGPE